MRRLLFVGLEVPNFPNVGWTNWQAASPLDYQGVVLNLREPPPQSETNTILSTLYKLGENHHSAFVLLPDAKNIQGVSFPANWIPDHHLYVIPDSGQTLKVVSGDPFFGEYQKALVGHEISFRLQGVHGRASGVSSGIVNNVSALLGANYGSIYILHPPPRRSEQKAVKAIIEHFKPDVPLPTTVPRPPWVDEIVATVPGVSEVESRRATILNEIRRSREQLEKEDEEVSQLTAWIDLLWQEGQPLQARVAAAFKLLGVAIDANDPTGHTRDLAAHDSGIDFVFEVTGTTGTISIDKGRQLMQWVTESADPSAAKGVLVANAFRNEAPTSRPPQDRRVFVAELERFAERFRLGLLDTRELYRVVCLRLSGRDVPKEIIVKGLNTDGIVRFNIE